MIQDQILNDEFGHIVFDTHTTLCVLHSCFVHNNIIHRYPVCNLELQQNNDIGEGQSGHRHGVGQVEIEYAERLERARHRELVGQHLQVDPVLFCNVIYPHDGDLLEAIPHVSKRHERYGVNAGEKGRSYQTS